jgi:carbon-monoxide dehydrogenase small subunit
VKQPVELRINGHTIEVGIEAHRTLLEVLRQDLGLTGTKEGCDGGECGACTVLIDGRAVLSCLTLAVEARGREITTIEGVADQDRLDPLQEAFIQEGAIQCGFCTPGMIMSAKGLLNRNPSPTLDEIKRGISGNLCRCTGYVKPLMALEKLVRK